MSDPVQIPIREMTDEQLREMLERIQEELEEREWDAIIAQPRVMKRMVELGEKALQDYKDGKTIAGGFDRIA